MFSSDLYNLIQARVKSGYHYGKYPVYDLTMSDVKKIESVSNKFGFPPEWMGNLINFESGGTFNPAIQNSIGATGIIQFMPATASGSCLGTTTTALKQMSFSQQMDYVDKYLQCNFNNLPASLYNPLTRKVTDKFTQTDLFMMIFYPVSVGNNNYHFPDSVKKENSGIATPLDYTNKALSASTAPFKNVSNYINKQVKQAKDNAKKTMAAAKQNLVPIVLFGVGIIGLTFITIKLARK